MIKPGYISTNLSFYDLDDFDKIIKIEIICFTLRHNLNEYVMSTEQ